MKEKINNYFHKLGNLPETKAIFKGFKDSLPIFLVGVFFIFIFNLPISGYQSYMNSLFNGNFTQYAQALSHWVFILFSIILSITICQAYIKNKSEVINGEIKEIYLFICSISALLSFYFRGDFDFTEMSYFGIVGAAFISIFSINLFLWIYRGQNKLINKIKIKNVKKNKKSHKKTSVISRIFSANFFTGVSRIILPMSIPILAFVLLGFLVYFFIPNGIVLRIVAKFITPNNNILTAVLLIFFMQFTLFLGVNSRAILADTFTLVYQEQGYFVRYTINFYQTVSSLATNGLIVAFLLAVLIIYICNKKLSNNHFSKAIIIPAIFNLESPALFGVPIVLNKFLLIPFIIGPTITTLLTGIFIQSGFIQAISTTDIPTTVPIFFASILYFSWQELLIQVLNISLLIGLFIPFSYLFLVDAKNKRLKVYKDLCQEVFNTQSNEFTQPLITRNDDVGFLANALLAQIKDSLLYGINCLHLEYQPKCLKDNTVVGAEGLLRFEHKEFGYISPAVSVRLVEEANLSFELGDWVIKTAWEDYLYMMHNGVHVSISANLSTNQLNKDPNLIKKFWDLIKIYYLDTTGLEIEVTENSEIHQSPEIKATMKKIRDLGINISIDDFGMGHSSLVYLSELYANVVKLDLKLSRSCGKDEISTNIVRTIIELCSKLNVTVIAEGVETKEQLEALDRVGCRVFQGWYFSKAIKRNEFIKYVKKNGFITPKNRNNRT